MVATVCKRRVLGMTAMPEEEAAGHRDLCTHLAATAPDMQRPRVA